MRSSFIYKDLKELRLSTVAGAWVFYFLTALLPTAFLLISAFAVFGVDLAVSLTESLPREFKETGEAVIKTAGNVSGGVTVFFVLSILFSGSAFLHQTCKDGEYIYGVKKKEKNGFLRRLWAMLAFALLFAAFLSMAFVFAFERLVLSLIFQSVGRAALILIAFSVIIIFCFFLGVMLNKFVSPVKIDFISAGTGNIVSVGVIVLGTIGFTLYLRFFSGFNAFYGTIATAVMFLLWIYVLMLGLVLGVAVSKKTYFHRSLDL
ncbi:MAG: YihY/virulence factor BrkB family protein [Clostridia bacterium]|nr:YihY/virulence factor BrkB family protein [Clostridia bacterium]